jgi:hypothetical protein
MSAGLRSQNGSSLGIPAHDAPAYEQIMGRWSRRLRRC